MGARGGAVDFVGEDDVGEDGAGLEVEGLLFLVVDGDAEDVGGEHVGGELDAVELAIDGAGERAGEDGFADAGDVFDEDVPAGDEADEDVGDGFSSAEEDGFHIGTEAGEWLHVRRAPRDAAGERSIDAEG